VVVTKLDRLARSLPDAGDILDELTRRNVKLSLGGSIHDPTDPVWRLLFNVLVMLAEFSVIWTRRYLDTPGRSPAGAERCGLMTWTPAREAGMRVVKEREDGIVRQVLLFDDGGAEVVIVNRFLSHLTDAGSGPNTVCAYAYDCAISCGSWLNTAWTGTTSDRQPRLSSWVICAGCPLSDQRSDSG
jgi:hypothetical protein